MNLLSVESLTAKAGGRTLFDSINFGIGQGEKVGLIGENGSGKSTILKCLTNQFEMDHGRIVLRNDARVSYLPQEILFDPIHTIRDHIYASPGVRVQKIHRYLQACDAILTDESDAAQRELDSASAEMHAEDLWNFEAEIKSILSILGIEDLDQPMRELSGGRLKKVGVAQVLIDDADLLLLDEPTNHLDTDTIDWLETALLRRSGAVLMVTHDRYFLERIVDRILEIERSQLYSTDGNYERYLLQKAEREAFEKRAAERASRRLKQELEWLHRQPKARTTKSRARIDRIDKLKDAAQVEQRQELSLVAGSRRTGKRILEIKNIRKAYNGQPLMGPFSYTFKGGERIGIVGANGSGKSTLLAILAERLPPDSGSVNTGVNTRIGFFDQHGLDLPRDRRVLDFVKNDLGEIIPGANGQPKEATRLLEDFGFSGALQASPISKLSGGERRRLQLACVLLSEPNFLILDEPTNDLDIATMAALEDFLAAFDGCLVVVSHDRYFLDRTTHRLLVFEEGADERPFTFEGNYTAYATQRRRAESAKAKTTMTTEGVSHAKPARFGFKERREFSELEKKIASLEEDRIRLEQGLAGEVTDPNLLKQMGEDYERTISELEDRYARWETLASLAESANEL